jgi:anti-anti-sigma factor
VASTTLTIIPTTGGAGVRLVGEVDLATAAMLAKALDELVSRDADVYLELGELQFVDISGVSVLVAVATSLGAGRTMVLHDPPVVLRQILDCFWPGVAGIRVDVS